VFLPISTEGLYTGIILKAVFYLFLLVYTYKFLKCVHFFILNRYKKFIVWSFMLAVSCLISAVWCLISAAWILLFDVRCLILTFWCLLSVFSSHLSDVSCQLPAAWYLMPAVWFPLSDACCLMPAIWYLLSDTCCLLYQMPAVCFTRCLPSDFWSLMFDSNIW